MLKNVYYVNRLLSKITSHNIKRAILYAIHFHKNQKRAGGLDYVTHPLSVAFYASEYSRDEEVIIAALLHDTLEDTTLTRDRIQLVFGSRCLEMVERLTRTKPKTAADTLRNAYQLQDLDTVLIKLCDRRHNLETIEAMRPSKQKLVAEETVRTFVPIAIAADFQELTNELIKLSCHILKPISEYTVKIDDHRTTYSCQRLYDPFELIRLDDNLL